MLLNNADFKDILRVKNHLFPKRISENGLRGPRSILIRLKINSVLFFRRIRLR